MTDPLALLDAASPRVLRALGFRRGFHASAHGPLHVLRAHGHGDLPPLVVLHGLGSSGADYAWAFGPFRRACAEVVLPDLYGHGSSARPSLPPAALRAAQLDALAALVPDRAILLGNSLGGVVATQLYPRVRERVQALVLVSPGGAPMTDAELAAFVRGFDLPDGAAARRFVADFLGRPAPWARPYAWGVRQRLARPHVRALIEGIRTEDLLTEADVRALDCPVMLYWGREDRVIPPAARAWWFAQLPHAVHRTPDHQGHAPFLDDPRDFAASVLAFLRRVVPARRGAGRHAAPV